MKLYYKPGACSLASHIALHEIGAPFEIEAVDTATGRTATGADFRAINPKGYVPALQIDDTDALTEGAAILQYLADSAPDAGLSPPAGTMARARMLEHLTFVSSELHKAFGPLFDDAATDPDKARARTKVEARLAHVETILADQRRYLVQDRFSIADAYLFVTANWANFTGIDLGAWPHLDAYVKRVAHRPATRSAMQAEGLIQ